MVNTALLQEAIDKSGLKESYIAENKLCISYQAYYNKKTGQSSFRDIEVNVLTDTLGLSEEQKNAIFFAENVQ